MFVILYFCFSSYQNYNVNILAIEKFRQSENSELRRAAQGINTEIDINEKAHAGQLPHAPIKFKTLGLVAMISKGKFFAVKERKTAVNEDEQKYSGIVGQVFISYSNAYIKQVTIIKCKLEDKGLSCWMCPINKRSHKPFEGIAESLENCFAFLAFYGQDYKNNVYCQEELCRAVQMKKLILGINMQKDYKSDGWLGQKLLPYSIMDLSENPDLDKINEIADLILSEQSSQL